LTIFLLIGEFITVIVITKFKCIIMSKAVLFKLFQVAKPLKHYQSFGRTWILQIVLV